ncbi:unnamed protein product, partial [Staurois parvus]
NQQPGSQHCSFKRGRPLCIRDRVRATETILGDREALLRDTELLMRATESLLRAKETLVRATELLLRDRQNCY